MLAFAAFTLVLVSSADPVALFNGKTSMAGAKHLEIKLRWPVKPRRLAVDSR